MIQSVQDYVQRTKEDYIKWKWPKDVPPCPWFRGEPACDTPLVPMLYRKERDEYYENRLNQLFRMKAPGFTKTPPRDHTDQWLFLARHVGLPTRFLDWTEGSLIALYFALQENNPIIWMINPLGLNDLSLDKRYVDTGTGYNIYGLTWVNVPEGKNIASENINGAWDTGKSGMQLPVAIVPTLVHPRMVAQRSCFTVHGKDKRGLYELVGSAGILHKYTINSAKRLDMLDEIRIMGITYGTLFPDIDGLAKDLTNQFRPDLLPMSTIIHNTEL